MWRTEWMAPLSVTLNDLEGHSLVAGLFKCNPLNICAAFYQIQLRVCLRGPSLTAGLLVYVGEETGLHYTKLVSVSSFLTYITANYKAQTLIDRPFYTLM